ncbi:BMP family lipoprotein [Anaerococcus sp. Marseille-P9784]|uniref:BMP family lipoprotein n=1 Tax=Anaerococcus sp. Marseille-P9784 TaxID=2614127 RepID=UPI00124AB085|nr:BMP family ABC transporter substrate-binding protein [Anaerococcus sp. Marseille-P9784]
MKKLLQLAGALLLTLSLSACATPANQAKETKEEVKQEETQNEENKEVENKDENKEETKEETGKKSDKPLKVAIVYTGLLGDKSYNDSANIGAKKATDDFGVEVTSLEGLTAQEWEANLISACEDDYDLIIGASSNIADFIQEHGPNYPDKMFAVIDTTVDLPNVQSISFAQNEGSFLAGAAAALFTQHTEIEGVNDKAIIGWVGGMDIPVLHDFYTGYEQGAKYINPDIKILQSFAGSWTDPLKGKELTLAQFDQGADIVMNVASGTGPGILEAAKEAGKYAIGVDLDQDNDQPGSVLTSMVKRVDSAVYLTIQSAVEGNFQGGSTKYLSLAENGVSLTDFSVMKEHLGDKFPQEIVDKVDELAKKIIDGEIKVDNYKGFGKEQ